MRLSASLPLSLVAFASVFVSGCESERPAVEAPLPAGEVESTPRGAETPGAASKDALATGPFVKRFEGIALQVPKGWQEVKPAGGLVGFIDSRFVIPAEAGPVELTCLMSGGGIDENVSRWIGQFDTAPDGSRTETLEVDGARATWVDLRGTFNGNASGKPGPHPKWRMLGAGIPVRGRACFLKLNGPEEAVAGIRDEFRKFVEGARLD